MCWPGSRRFAPWCDHGQSKPTTSGPGTRAAALAQAEAEHEKKVKAEAERVATQHAEVDSFRESYEQRSPEALVTYCSLVLAASQYPDTFPQQHKIAYVPESRQLVIEMDLRPVLEFNMVDPRFVQETDVLSSIDERPNLMELTPGEFENLITNLFEKMGLETRLTQASRDGGVDCVAYDPRPIFGGKVVIQAKRYKHTVGVSAVRDLFGTMQNEGASKGILVTTSGYGKASFEFASPTCLAARPTTYSYAARKHASVVPKRS